MSGWAHPDKFRFFADFTGADPRRKLGDTFSEQEILRQRAEAEENGQRVERIGEGLIATSEDGQRSCGFWPVHGVDAQGVAWGEDANGVLRRLDDEIEKTKEIIKQVVSIRRGDNND